MDPFLRKTFLTFIITVFGILVLLATLTVDPDSNETPKESNSTKFILMWTKKPCAKCPPLTDRFLGYSPFEKCKYNMCYLSVDRNKVENGYTNYDAFVFHGKMISEKDVELPETRFSGHKYIFFNLESPTRYPVCDQKYDDFFNWTITFKLDSDIAFPYIRVKNKSQHVIGPRKFMKWPAIMEQSLDPDYERILEGKTKMAAWFGSECNGKNKRLRFVKKLNREMTRLNQSAMTVDVYGACGLLECGKEGSLNCSDILKKEYLFFMALEDSLDPDFVTELVLVAFKNDLVPIVYSKTKYSRFLPPFSYLDGHALGPKRLAEKMVYLYNNRNEYSKYFEWKQYYNFETTRFSSFACDLCEMMHTKINKTTQYKEFREWWSKDYLTACDDDKIDEDYYDDDYDL